MNPRYPAHVLERISGLIDELNLTTDELHDLLTLIADKEQNDVLAWAKKNFTVEGIMAEEVTDPDDVEITWA